MAKQTTGEFLATLRKANGYTQQAVAEKLNISNRTLSSWETDRTLPDVLMLPAIADLYNVTVDELLRGERSNNSEKSAEISETSLKNVYKNKYSRLSIDYGIILGIALVFATLSVIGWAIALWTAAPAWLVWVLIILGIVGLCACIAITIYRYDKEKLSVGVAFDEDLTEDKRAFITALRYKIESFILICALPFALFALGVLIYFKIANPQNGSIDIGNIITIFVDVRFSYRVTIGVNFALAAMLLIVHCILKAITAKRFFSETQKAAAKANRKLAGKLAMFGAIPIAVVIVLSIILIFAFPNGNKTLYKSKNIDTFKTHMQTLIIGKDAGAPAGEYYLPIPETPEHETEYDLGNGFYGEYAYKSMWADLDGNIHYYGEYWSISYGRKVPPDNPNEEFEGIPVWNLFIYKIETNNFVVNARYYLDDHHWDYYGTQQRNCSVERRNNNYCFVQNISDILSDIMFYTFAIVPICTVVTCPIIYAVKHKKQKYNF